MTSPDRDYEEASVYAENADIKRRLHFHIKSMTINKETQVATVRQKVIKAEELAKKLESAREESGYGKWS